MKPKNRRLGYSLIELAVVLAVLGLIAGMGLSLLGSHNTKKQLADMSDQMLQIRLAIKHHLVKYGYLPCPAARDAAEDTANFGRSENCGVAAVNPGVFDAGTVRVGSVPVRTLNLPDRMMYDAWSMRLTYAVVENLARDQANYNAYANAETNGVIELRDVAGAQIPPSTSALVVAYLVVSHGKDKKGAYNKAGAITVPCGATGKDFENCDNDKIFVNGDITESDVVANYYDDILEWRTKAYLELME